MSAAGRTFLIDAFPDSAFRHRERDAVVCIDVMLATTTLVTASRAGRRVFVAGDLQEAQRLKAAFPDARVAHGREVAASPLFTLTDDPRVWEAEVGDGRPLVVLSPGGTTLIARAADAGPVFLGSFRNLSATATALAGRKRVALLCAGFHDEWSCEDQMAASWIALRLLEQGFTAEDRRTEDVVRRWKGIAPSLAGWGNSAAWLRHEGRSEEVEFVMHHVDDVTRACVCEGREVRSLDPQAAQASLDSRALQSIA